MIAVVCGDATITRWPPKTPGALGWDGQPYQAIRFADGATLDSAPVYDPETTARAARLGYGGSTGGALRMWQHHDVAHQWLAVRAGEPHSATLWAAAHGQLKSLTKGTVPAEEERVFALQALLAGGEWEPGAFVALRVYAGCELDTLVQDAKAFLAQFEETNS